MQGPADLHEVLPVLLKQSQTALGRGTALSPPVPSTLVGGRIEADCGIQSRRGPLGHKQTPKLCLSPWGSGEP